MLMPRELPVISTEKFKAPCPSRGRRREPLCGLERGLVQAVAGQLLAKSTNRFSETVEGSIATKADNKRCCDFSSGHLWQMRIRRQGGPPALPQPIWGTLTSLKAPSVTHTITIHSSSVLLRTGPRESFLQFSLRWKKNSLLRRPYVASGHKDL